jgi:hypothetical protein
MRFLESLMKAALERPNARVESLLIGWKGSLTLLSDGRTGLGWAPSFSTGSTQVRNDIARRLISASAHDLVSLYASPFPQESAAASAAMAALCSPEGGLGLESLIPLPGDSSVALLDADRPVKETLEDWGWTVTSFGERTGHRRTLPGWTSTCAASSFRVFWLSGRLVPDGTLRALVPVVPQGSAVIVQGPGIPFVPDVLYHMGVQYLVLPQIASGAERSCLSHIAAGGDPWLSPHVLWRAFRCVGTDTKDFGTP